MRLAESLELELHSVQSTLAQAPDQPCLFIVHEGILDLQIRKSIVTNSPNSYGVQHARDVTRQLRLNAHANFHGINV